MTQLIYEVVTSFDEQKVIKRTNEDGTLSFIPMDESNSDYQAYLNKDKAEQSTPSVTNGD